MKKQTLFALAAAAMVAGTVSAQLTEAQSAELQKASQGFAQQVTILEGLMENKLTELALELKREGRLDTEQSADAASAKSSAILTDLGKLYGEYIKAKVHFVLEAKNVLTDEQKMLLLSQLAPGEAAQYDSIVFLQPDVFDLPLNLSLDQEKQLIALEGELLKKEISIETEAEMILLDLRPILMGGVPQPEKVDPLVMKLADLAAQGVNNRVAYFNKAKDVLTLDQKRLLSHMLGLN